MSKFNLKDAIGNLREEYKKYIGRIKLKFITLL